MTFKFKFVSNDKFVTTRHRIKNFKFSFYFFEIKNNKRGKEGKGRGKGEQLGKNIIKYLLKLLFNK